MPLLRKDIRREAAARQEAPTLLHRLPSASVEKGAEKVMKKSKDMPLASHAFIITGYQAVCFCCGMTIYSAAPVFTWCQVPFLLGRRRMARRRRRLSRIIHPTRHRLNLSDPMRLAGVYR
jgi:hypothetical protein